MSPTVPPLRHHAAFDRLVLFEYRLTCRTGLHIGAGKSAALVGSDLPVLRDGQGKPLVPGSSLRGILRSGLEALSLTMDLSVFEKERDAKPPEGAPKEVVKVWKNLTPIQRMFGYVPSDKAESERIGSALGSRLQISDAVCSADFPIELRDGVAINRETRTASGGKKFDLEVVPAGTAFKGQVRFKNPLATELGLLAQSFWMLDQGMLLLGGKTARGLGWVQAEVTAPKEFDARSILSHGARPPRGSASSDDFGPVEERMSEYLAVFQVDSSEEEISTSSAPSSQG